MTQIFQNGFLIDSKMHDKLKSLVNPPHPFSIVLNHFWFTSKDQVRVLNSNVKPGSSLEFQILNLLRTIEMCVVGI